MSSYEAYPSYPWDNESASNLDRQFGADALAKIFKYSNGSNGFFVTDTTEGQVLPGGGMSVNVNDVFVHLDGHFRDFDDYAIKGIRKNIPIAAAGILPRYSRIIIRRVQSMRDIFFEELQGTPSEVPVPPTLTNNADIGECSSALIYVGANVTEISSENITDERFEPDVGGIISPQWSRIENPELFNQYMAELENLRQALSDTLSGGIPDASVSMPKLASDVRDAVNNTYIHAALSTIAGTGANGYFTAAFSGTVSQINGMAVKAGEETEVELVAGVVYWFTIIGNTINFKVGGAGKDEYSTTETKTNKVWIDGRPIYRTVYEGGAIANDTTVFYDLPENLDFFIDIRGTLWTSATTINSVVTSQTAGVPYRVFAFTTLHASGKIQARTIQVSGDRHVVIAEYTKII